MSVAGIITQGLLVSVSQVITLGLGAGAAPPLGTVARPDADTTAGGWLPSTGSSLYAMIDEVSPDTADYIYATTATTCKIALSPVAEPATSGGQRVSYIIDSPPGDGLTVKLLCGVTVIASWTHDPAPATPTRYDQYLSGAECDAIADWTTLYYTFESL